MHDYNVFPAPQGWECPKCKRVYSPSTIMCMYCPQTTTTHNQTTFPPIGLHITGVTTGTGTTITATNSKNNDSDTI